ncbi:C-type mannose receptor 2 [Anabrus simplex]|uniref:C-type mannose receptor 2 n=1 Tax=Anabrus simplex TaxID=316456 RepID=UPI0035A3D5A0
MLFLVLAALLCAGALGTGTEPPLDCSCQMSGQMKFSAAHSKDKDGKWNTQIAVTRGGCNSTEGHTDVLTVPFPEVDKTNRIQALSLVELGYQNNSGIGQYKLYTYGETWDGARRRCAADGAHLAIPNSAAEAAILKQLIQRHSTLPHTKSNDLAWLGLHDMFNEGIFMSIYGEPMTAVGWDEWDPLPDNAGWSGSNPGEDCVAFHKTKGKMTDFRCDSVLAFFCESEAGEYPPPGSPDYSAGAYIGIEQERKPLTGKVFRRRPSPGYELFAGVGYYKFHSKSATWDEARKVCRDEGGHLAIINSPQEEQVLIELFKRHKRLFRHVTNVNFIFIGFHDQISEANYMTLYGEPLTSAGFYTWYANEPNDDGIQIPGEDCGVLGFTGGLGDAPCLWMLAYVCEQELYL